MQFNPKNTLTLIFVLLVLFSLVWAVYPFVTNPTSVTDAYRSAGIFAPAMFLILVAILPTPGAVIGASAVSYFGLWTAWLLLYIGNVLAVLITFVVIRRWGRPAVQRFLQPKKLAEVDTFIAKHPILLWVVYAFPIFPLELVTSVIALSDRPLKRFIIIPIIALPIDALIVTSFGSLLTEYFGPALEYASIAIVVIFAYGLVHFFYRWKREEIHATGKAIGDGAMKSARAIESGMKAGVSGVTRGVSEVSRGVNEGVKRIRRRQ